MAVPPTEVSVKRPFSHFEIILTDRQNRLLPNLLEAIFFLRLDKKFAAIQKNADSLKQGFSTCVVRHTSDPPDIFMSVVEFQSCIQI